MYCIYSIRICSVSSYLNDTLSAPYYPPPLLQNLVKEFITKDYQASVGMVIDRALRGDETANYEFPLMTKDGVRIEILLNATARRNPDGKIIGVVGKLLLLLLWFVIGLEYLFDVYRHNGESFTHIIYLFALPLQPSTRHWTGKSSV